jgi:3-oxoacyl-[acyl-carrier-protein] synthase II
MEDALSAAQINSDQIDYISGHASSTQLNDANECACVKKVFGSGATKIPVSGTKAFYGHPLGASAAIEAAVCLLAMQHDFVPPTLNYETPDPACDLDVVPNQPRQKPIHYALSNAFGFGGINSCVVFRKV